MIEAQAAADTAPSEYNVHEHKILRERERERDTHRDRDKDRDRQTDRNR